MTTHDPAHRQTWDLIPWLVNGTLDADQRESVDAHLQHCPDCREELAFQRRVHAGIADDPMVADTTASTSLARLFNRIDAEDALPAGFGDRAAERREALARSSASAPANGRHRGLGRVLAVAVVVEAFGLIALTSMMINDRNQADARPEYSTLSRSGNLPAKASIRLVPSPTLSVADLQQMLGESGLRIVDSNPGGTILALAPDGGAMDTHAKVPDSRAALLRLRAHAGVLLAEPILAPGSGQ